MQKARALLADQGTPEFPIPDQRERVGHAPWRCRISCAVASEGPRNLAALDADERSKNQKEWKRKVGYGRRWLVEIGILRV